jgi:hypothetical protein
MTSLDDTPYRKNNHGYSLGDTKKIEFVKNINVKKKLKEKKKRKKKFKGEW